MKRAYLLVLLLFPLLYSCATRTETVQEESDADVLVTKLKEYNSSIHAIEAAALLLYADGDKTYSFRVQITVHNNGKNMRLDLADFIFKKPILTIVKNNDKVTALLHAQKKFYLTTYEDLSIEELSGLKLRKEILLPALMGKIYVDSEGGSVSSPDPETLIIESEEYRETVTFSHDWLPRSAEYIVEYGVYSMTLESFTAIDGVYFPRKVTLTNMNRRIEATYKDVKVNGGIDTSLFLVDEKSLAGYTRKSL
jgi:outer membrane lipoprotein-sorting protein